ncbi:hypothetical protein [Paracoccus laeviglucosivorans]|uniref:hypothetical protein n=1 Tax=Paracoccus laeviglucosivorans TaxID=1197861 RepID=UPI001C8F6686|nr:hypothetical protein [Paracoccus laeviglucosivorans]
MRWKNRNIRAIADMICGNVDHFPYRTGRLITEFFEDCGLDLRHDGRTRRDWVARRLTEVLAAQTRPDLLPDAFASILRNLLDRAEAEPDDPDRSAALAALNAVLQTEGWVASYDAAGVPHLRCMDAPQLQQLDQLADYLDRCSEDEFIETVLLPIFRHLGFQRVTATGHREGSGIWQGRVDEADPADAACAVFRHSGEKGPHRCRRQQPSRCQQHWRGSESGADDAGA